MFRSGFHPQEELTSGILTLKPFVAGDFDALFAAAADSLIWAGHPARDRHRRDVFEGFFQLLLQSGTALVVIDRASGETIGCSRYYQSADQADGLAIGFTFLCRAHWGGQTNFELKRLMLGHAFGSYEEVWFHIDPANVRSQKATARLGAEHAYDAVLDFSGSPVLWRCYRLSKDVWSGVLAERGAGDRPSSTPLDS